LEKTLPPPRKFRKWTDLLTPWIIAGSARFLQISCKNIDYWVNKSVFPKNRHFSEMSQKPNFNGL
jgi:hypothetical protein